MKRKLTLILAIAVAASLGVSAVAEAHTLPDRIAQKAANKFGKKLGQVLVDQNPNLSPATYRVDRCSRRNAHRFVCKLRIYGNDSDTGQSYDCRGYIIVQAEKDSYRYNVKLKDESCSS